MIRAVFFDIDGTLLSHSTNSVPEKTMRALHALREQGIKVIICTGRHAMEMEELGMFILPADGYILLNGVMVMNEKHEIIASTLRQLQAISLLLLSFSTPRQATCFPTRTMKLK